MTKTPTQEKLEAQKGKDIADIVVEALEQRKGKRNLVVLAALDLGVTDATLYSWCDRLGVKLDDYR